MTATAHSALYELIRSYMNALGTSRTTLVALESYMNAIGKLRCPSQSFGPLIRELNHVIKSTEPKVVPLISLLEEFEIEIAPFFGQTITQAKKKALEIIGRKLARFEKDTLKLTQLCMDCIAPGDLIVVHSATAYIRNALIRAHTESKRNFKVLALKQGFQRTKDMENDLSQNQVEHILIPEHNLSHYLKSASKLFVGAVSITSDHHAVIGIGTANVISLCHFSGVPVYLFAESLKFAKQPLPDQNIHQEKQDRMESEFTFHMTTFSHDVVPLAMIDHLITEEGESQRVENQQTF